MKIALNTLTDEEIIAEYLTYADSKYFEVIYNRYSRKVYGKCLFLLKEKDLAEDAVQEIFMKLIMKLSKFSGRSKFSTWMYSVTYNYCIDTLRKRQRGKEIFNEQAERVSDVIDEVEDHFIVERKVARLKVVMEMMKAEDKSILLMKYLDGMSIKEIGEVLDKSDSAIKMKIKRAKHKFQKIYFEMYKE